MTGLRVLLFDVFGTLVDWRSSLIGIAAAAAAGEGVQADWAPVVDDWRRAYQPALDQARTEATWRDLDTIQRETLASVLARHHITLSAAAQETLVRGWRQLRPWPDSQAGLDRLRRRHVTATLSNGHLALLADLLKFAGLRVDALLSAQLAASYKPAPEVYRTAVRLLDCPARGGRDGGRAPHRPDRGRSGRPAADLRPPAAGVGSRPRAGRTRRPWMAWWTPPGSTSWPRCWTAQRPGCG